MSIERLILITRPTRLEEAIRRFNTRAQAKFYIEQRGHSFDDYEREYSNYRLSLERVLAAFPHGIKTQTIARDFLPNFLFTEKDAIITLGQDGLVVNTAKYLDRQPIIAVNPDPERFDGILLPFVPDNLHRVIESVFAGRSTTKNISMARADLNDGQKLLAFNDFFIGPKSHTSARYTLQYRSREERQSSSGIIVSTPAGSTGWLSSLYNMTSGMARALGFDIDGTVPTLDWEERRLMFVVREPFRSKWSGADIVAGELADGEELVLMSHMPEDGVIFSDGILQDYLQFNAGATAIISIAEKTTNLVVANDSIGER